MLNLTLIQEVDIPEFPISVQLSKKRQKRYYRKSHKLPKTYKEKVDEGIWTFKGEYLYNEDDTRVLKNPKAAGTSKYHKLAGNDFTSGMHYAIRKKIVKEMKKFYSPFIEQLNPINADSYPLIILWEMHTVFTDYNQWDASNMWFYYKYFEDTLFTKPNGDRREEPIITDDNYEYVTGVCGPILYPVEIMEERKIVVKFYKDNRNLDHPIWKN